jgi:hypothetical protein
MKTLFSDVGRCAPTKGARECREIIVERLRRRPKCRGVRRVLGGGQIRGRARSLSLGLIHQADRHCDVERALGDHRSGRAAAVSLSTLVAEHKATVGVLTQPARGFVRPQISLLEVVAPFQPRQALPARDLRRAGLPRPV